MSTPQEIYATVKPDLATLARPLFAQSEKLLRERGDFLPHAAVLTPDGKVSLVGAMLASKEGFANSWHILPLLYNGLRSMASERDLVAIGIAENVESVPGGGGLPGKRAVKVQLEHCQGLTIAFYMPFWQESPGEYAFEKTFTIFTESEVNAWRRGPQVR
jgi:hypothetical protein